MITEFIFSVELSLEESLDMTFGIDLFRHLLYSSLNKSAILKSHTGDRQSRGA